MTPRKQIPLRLPPELVERVDIMAAVRNLSRNEMIRFIIQGVVELNTEQPVPVSRRIRR